MSLLDRLRIKIGRHVMAKNIKKRRAPAPYTKYHKTPYIYSQAYREWKRAVMSGRAPKNDNWKSDKRNQVRNWKEAAE